MRVRGKRSESVGSDVASLISKWRGSKLCNFVRLKITLIWIVSVLHQNEGGILKSLPDAQEISRDPRNILRAKPEGGGDGFSNTSQVLVEYGHSPHHLFIYGDGSGNPSLWAGKD